MMDAESSLEFSEQFRIFLSILFALSIQFNAQVCGSLCNNWLTGFKMNVHEWRTLLFYCAFFV
jgi:hypothetical protein